MRTMQSKGWGAVVAAFLFCMATGASAQREATGAFDPVNLFREWRPVRVAQILENADPFRDRLVNMVGYVGPQPEAAAAGRANRYVLIGYEGGAIDVEFVGSRPLVNEHVYVLGHVKIERGQAFIQQATRFKMDDDRIREWKDFSLDFAIENAFRTQMVGLTPLSRADWSEGRRTTIREIEEFIARPGHVAPPVDPAATLIPPVEPRSPQTVLLRALPWIGVALLAVVILIVALTRQSRPRATVERLPSTPTPVHAPPPAPVAAPPPSAPAAAAPSLPPPEDDKTRVPERGTRALMGGQPIAASEKTLVWRPGYLEVVEGSPRREKVRLDTETVLGRDWKSDKGDIRGYFVQLQMDDRPREIRSQCSRLYCKIQYRAQDRVFVLSNITDNDNPIRLNGKELISGEAETLKDGDEIVLRPDWKFIFHTGSPS